MDSVYMVIMYVIDDSDEILHVCRTKERAEELAERERADCDYEIGVQEFAITE